MSSDPEFKWFEVTAYKPDGTKVKFDVVTTYTDPKFGSHLVSNVHLNRGYGDAEDELATAMTDLLKATRTAAMRKFPG